VPTSTRIEVLGAKDTLKALNKIDKQLRKQFNADAKAVAKPAIEEAQRNYVNMPLSGMARKWNTNGKQVFPYDKAKAVKGVQIKVDTSRKSSNAIAIQQRDPGTAIFESAGRKTSNRLGDSLGSLAPGRTRILGPSVLRKRREVEQQMKQLVLEASRRVQEELNR
jgi:hypothetical protein